MTNFHPSLVVHDDTGLPLDLRYCEIVLVRKDAQGGLERYEMRQVGTWDGRLTIPEIVMKAIQPGDTLQLIVDDVIVLTMTIRAEEADDV